MDWKTVVSYVSTFISGCSLWIVYLTFKKNNRKDRDADRDEAKENNIKMNLKLDQLCNNTNQILLKQEKQEDRIHDLEIQNAETKRDMKTIFEELKEIKGKVN